MRTVAEFLFFLGMALPALAVASGVVFVVFKQVRGKP